MQPYQQASEAIKGQLHMPQKLAKAGASLALTVAGTSALGSIAKRVLPFLNQHIPLDIMRKGLDKVDTRFGKFMDLALGAGVGIQQTKDFIKFKILEEEEQTEDRPDPSSKPYTPPYEGSIRQLLDSGQVLKTGEYNPTPTPPPSPQAAVQQGDERLLQAMQNLQMLLDRGRKR
jgi:hypothetical protein